MVIFDNDLSLPEAIAHGEIPASKNRAKLEPSKKHVRKIMKPMYSTIFLRRKIWRLLVSKCFKDVDGFPSCHDDTNRLSHWKGQRCIVQGKHPKYPKDYHPHHLEFHPLSIPSHRAPQARSRIGIINIYIYMHINMIIYDSICIQNCPRLIQICTLSYFFIIFDYWAYLASLIPFPVHEEQPPEIMAPVGDRNTGMGDRIDHSILAT